MTTPPSLTTHRPTDSGSQPAPTSGKENSKAMWYVVGMVAIAVVAVIGFNVMGPKSNTSRMGESTPAAATTSSAGSGMAPAIPTASSPAQGGNQGPALATPQSADTPVDASRNTMGAPAGASLPSPYKPAPAQTSTDGTVPMQATAPARDVPASPASR